MSKANRELYVFIRIWGRQLRSFPYYIDQQIARAQEEGAPATATFRRDDGSWATVDDMAGEDRQLAMYREAFLYLVGE